MRRDRASISARSGTTCGCWRRRRRRGPRAQVMSVVKADGYGHGMVESGRAARQGGADWLGVATVGEALALREARRHRPAPLLAHAAGRRRGRLARARGRRGRRRDGVHGGAPGRDRRGRRGRRRAARVQLKVDTGLSRGGAAHPRLAGAGRPRGGPREAGPGPGHGRLVALRLQRRAASPRQRPSGGPVPRRPPGRPGRRAPSRGPPPRQLGRRAAPPLVAVLAGAVRHSRPTGSTRHPARPPTSDCDPRCRCARPSR